MREASSYHLERSGGLGSTVHMEMNAANSHMNEPGSRSFPAELEAEDPAKPSSDSEPIGTMR